MSFVAQPYEQFASDLLTSLTGGMSREEHRFVGPDEAYSLTTRGVVVESLRVAGQRNEEFAAFERGIDYVFDEPQQAIRWKEGASLPDERSYFYISYYPQEARPRLTDRNPGSVTTTLAEAFARELAVLHRQMEMIYRSAFLDLATGSALDHVVALLGLSRKDARFALGEVLFKRASPAPGDIAIPSGTLVSTDQAQNFETTDKRTLRRGQLSVVVPIRAQVEGPPGKVSAGDIKSINRPIFGVESVVNEAATFFAARKETDEELQRRARGALERAGRSTVDAIKYALIEDLPEINEANVQVAEKPETPGLVEVRLGLEAAADPDLVRRIEESIFAARPAGVRVVHNLPSRSVSDSARQAQSITREQALGDLQAQGEPPDVVHLEAHVLDGMPEGVLRLRVEVFLRLAEPNLTGPQKETIEDAARATLVDYIEALPMGAPLIYHKLLGRLVAPETVADARLLVGADSGGQFHAVADNLSTEGRKARADAIFVGLMEETVSLEVLVRLQGNPAEPGGQDAKATEALQSALTDAVNLQWAGRTNGITKKDTADVVRAALAARVPPELQLVADNPVVINARYEETGRILNDTEQVTLAGHERPVLDKLTLKVLGTLDV